MRWRIIQTHPVKSKKERDDIKKYLRKEYPRPEYRLTSEKIGRGNYKVYVEKWK